MCGICGGLKVILVGPADEFNRNLASKMSIPIIDLQRRVFPDGEVCPRIMIEREDQLRGEEVILSMRMPSKSCNPNSYLVEVLLAVRNLREHIRASNIQVIMPYFPYARQDNIFRPGEPLSAKYVANLLEEAGVETVYAVTVHLHRVGSFPGLFQRARGVNISGFPSLAEVLKRMDLVNPYIIAPDEEALVWAKEVAECLGTEDYVAFIKERDLETGEIRTTIKEIDVRGRDAVVIDDIVSTGGTMANAVRAVREMGARRVYSAFVHPVLVGNALDRIIGGGANEIIASDTLIWEGSKASVVDQLVEEIKGR
ncbi:MAG TPA: ribose-phosphate diphosphokinase [Candidatus Korarchaeota archaeon]|nr:ribose-phosphate diphosphokinase [Candidatus Korarchaeota archaeon]